MASADGGLEFLAGGGFMGERIRAYPWESSPLGEPRGWPQSLRTMVRVLLTTGHPTMIFWGPELTCLYNDPFSRSLGPEKHPAILGAPGRRAWEEVWPIVGAQIEQVLRGEGAVWHENQCVPIIRHGELQEVYWTYSYSPIDEPAAPYGVGGVLVTCSETTEQVLSERRLAAEREEFVRLFDQAPTFLAVLRGPDHVIELANPGYLALVGHRPVVGRRIADALPEAAEQGYIAILDEAYRTGTPYSAFGSKYVPHGVGDAPSEERFVDFVFQPITNPDGSVRGILVQGVDVTARTATDRALQRLTAESERLRRLYETVLSATPDFVYVFSLDHRVLYANDSLIRMWGRGREGAIGKTFLEIGYEPWHAEMHEREIDQVRTTKVPVRGEVPFNGTHGRRIYDYIFVPVIGADGEVEAVAGTTRDVTDRKESELALAESDRKKDEFIALLAHELRNPLAPIRTGLQVLRQTPDRAVRERTEVIMDRQLTHMVRLIDDLLDASRIGRHKLELRRARITIADVVESAVEAARPSIDAGGHELLVSLPARPVHLDADLTRLAQVLSNLLTNAAKYTGQGGTIWLSAACKPGVVDVTVKDTGIGIPRESLGTIFDLFSQVDRSIERTSGGLGIGLALVKGLTEMHGGTVRAESDGEHRGSTFVVTLPTVEDAELVADRPLADEPSPPASPAPPGRRVLVVDDSRDGAESLGLMLELEGHEVAFAHDGLDAIERGAQFRPEVILMDVGMPRLNGLDATRQIRQTSWGKAVTIIALTGWGQEADLAQSRDAGCDGHLVKPVDPETLHEILSASRHE